MKYKIYMLFIVLCVITNESMAKKIESHYSVKLDDRVTKSIDLSVTEIKDKHHDIIVNINGSMEFLKGIEISCKIINRDNQPHHTTCHNSFDHSNKTFTYENGRNKTIMKNINKEYKNIFDNSIDIMQAALMIHIWTKNPTKPFFTQIFDSEDIIEVICNQIDKDNYSCIVQNTFSIGNSVRSIESPIREVNLQYHDHFPTKISVLENRKAEPKVITIINK